MKHRLLLFVIVSTLTMNTSVFAQKRGGQKQNKQDSTQDRPCKSDIEKYCAGSKPGPELGQCMDQHASELSSECKTFHEQIKKRAESNPLNACKGDIEQNCKDIQPGEGRMIKCLKEKESSLSSECQTALNNLPEKPGHAKK